MITLSRRAALMGLSLPLAARLVAAPKVAATTAGNYRPNSQERAVLNQLNKYRDQKNRGQLILDDSLGAAARDHAADMARRDYLSHNAPKPKKSTPKSRARKKGFRGTFIGENIAAGQTSATQVMNDWKRSTGHDKNMLSRNYTHVGIGYASKGRERRWVQLFGRAAED